MRKVMLLLLFIFSSLPIHVHAADDRVRITYASRSISAIFAFIANDRGFFKEEKLEPQLILTRSTTAIAAAVAGDGESSSATRRPLEKR